MVPAVDDALGVGPGALGWIDGMEVCEQPLHSPTCKEHRPFNKRSPDGEQDHGSPEECPKKASQRAGHEEVDTGEAGLVPA